MLPDMQFYLRIPYSTSITLVNLLFRHTIAINLFVTFLNQVFAAVIVTKMSVYLLKNYLVGCIHNSPTPTRLLVLPYKPD